MQQQSSEKIKVLMVLGTLNYGGAEIFCLNLLKQIDRHKYQVDFVVNSLTRSDLENEITLLGSSIHVIPRFNGISFRKYRRNWKKLLKVNHYDIVHGHASGAMSIYLSVAKKLGCKTIAHSHSASNRGNLVQKFGKKIWSYNAKKYADYWFACSDLAAKRLFGRKYLKSNKYVFVPNGIDIERYGFSNKNRESIRNELKLSNQNIVVGHVGSFTKPKNHEFLLNVFYKLYSMNKNYRLVLCGDGERKTLIVNEVAKLGLTKVVYFIGNTNETEKYYSAFDVFVFPSLFEGLPVSLIEAQCNGLTIVCSNNITRDVCVSECIFKLGLDYNLTCWTEKINSLAHKKIDRSAGKRIISTSPFTIQNTCKVIETIYEKLINN